MIEKVNGFYVDPAVGLLTELSPSDVEDLYAREKRFKGPLRARVICLCGHAIINKHSILTNGKVHCSPNNWTCYCTKQIPVLVASNLRVFIQTSTGDGERHALQRGINALLKTSGHFEWLPGSRMCFDCGVYGDIRPTIVTYDGISVTPEKGKISNQMDIMLCGECYKAFRLFGKRKVA